LVIVSNCPEKTIRCKKSIKLFQWMYQIVLGVSKMNIIREIGELKT
jgi:hypothetical protein